MKTISQTFAILLALLLLGALAYAAIAAIEYASTLYTSLDPQLARASAILLFAVLIAAWTITHGIRRATAQRMRRQLSDEITATYQYFTDYWSERIEQGHESNGDPEARQNLARLMTLYGSAEVLKAHMALQTILREKDTQDAELRAQFGKALLAIRKDLGADTRGISAQQLQQLVLSQADVEVRPTEMPQPQRDSELASGV